jgi:hypothetical protein
MWTETILSIFGILLCVFIYWTLLKSNMDVPPNAEKALGPLGRLKFALDNDLPVKTPLS